MSISCAQRFLFLGYDDEDIKNVFLALGMSLSGFAQADFYRS